MMLFLLCSFSGFSYAADNSDEVTVTGNLTFLYVIGGETSGWAVKLDQPLQVEDETLSIIEIDPLGKKINLIPFLEETVDVTGKLAKREGIERGHYWVIELESISLHTPDEVDLVTCSNSIVFGSSCIGEGETCIKYGKPCCSPYKCSGKFPNTTCQ